MKNKALFPILAGFFVMGFGGIIGTVMFQIKNECASHADQISYLIPIFAYLWFVLISIPTGLLCGRKRCDVGNRFRTTGGRAWADR